MIIFNSHLGGLHDYSSEFYGLNIKSLCQPAVLPLSTSFLCSVKSLNEDYHDQGVYSLVFDSSVSKEGAEDCVLEMVCQRLSQEFQLVEGIDMTPYRTYLANHNIGSLTKGKSDVEELYILSMGHRIHFLLYNRIQREVKVSRIKLMNASSDPSDKSGGVRTRYEYELWVPPTMRFHVMTQNFFQYPVPEYSWNTADAIITGYNNLEPPFGKYKMQCIHAYIP